MRNLFMKLIAALRNSTGITDTNVTLDRRAQAAEDRAARLEYVQAQVRARTVRQGHHGGGQGRAAQSGERGTMK